ncbi:hypothetical protein HOLleu_16758 [Holothuria leucospilota]|uniref:Nuclear pore complex protein Nup214 n=1 Tax=Holothuria leucospilota TaxID=206669 RepID=A0A9Q1HAU0_HOLLE|nr:hypothetical protein HOLleu_16758 [Holothuria leucospilota]
MTDEAGIGVGPSERQVNTLTFQQLCHFQIFDEKPETLSPKERYQLIAVSNKYGFTFVGTNAASIKIIKTDDLARISEEMQETPGCTVEEYPHQILGIESRPVHISLNCDEQILSVVLRGDTSLQVHLYDVVDICRQVSSAKPFITTSLSKEPNVDLIDLQWNPTSGSLFSVCLSDGVLVLWYLCEGKIGQLSTLSTSIKANAICWSPKGKQIVVGTSDGQLIQFTHKMEQKKVVGKPDFTNEPVKVVDVLWPSTYMWVVAYIDSDETVQPNLTIVHAPKDQPSSFINFEDICYGGGEDRKAKYYMKFLDKWGFVIASSGNSMETGILGQNPEDNTKWDIWTLDDSARIELPLHESGDDTFPMGLGIDFSSERPFTAKNKEKRPAVPIVMVLSSEGLLCPFHIVNTEAKESLQQKIEPLPAEAVHKGTGQSSTDGQPAGMGQPNQGSIQLTTNSVAPSVTKPPAQQQTNSPFSFAPSQKPSGGAFSFGGSSSSGLTLSHPSDESSSSTTQSKPFSFSLSSGSSGSASTQPTEGSQPFSFSKPTTLTTQAPTSSFPSFSFSKPQGMAGMSTSNSTGGTPPQGLFGSSSSGQAPGALPLSVTKPQGAVSQPSKPQGTAGISASNSTGGAPPQGLFGSSSSGQAPGASPFSFAKPQGAVSQPSAATASSGAQSTAPASFAFSKPQGIVSQPSASTSSSGAQSATPASFSFTKPQGTASPFGQLPSGGPFSFAKPQGNSTQPVAPASSSLKSAGTESPKPLSSLGGMAQTQGTVAQPSQTTGGPSSLGSLVGGPGKPITSTGQASRNPPQTSAPPNQVAPLMKTLPFKVTEEPQGQSSQITIPKVQDAPKTPGNLSVTIPIEHQKGAMQARTQKAAEGGTATRVPYRPVVEPVSPVSTISTQGGEEHLQSALMSNILDEMEHFEKEVCDLKARTRDGKYTVGNRQELQTIRKSMDNLVAFQADVLECTKSLNEDIHGIKAKLLNSFKLLEESKIRRQRNQDPKFVTLLKARGLDPQTESKMQNMKAMVHYLDVGTRDVNLSLDMEWEEQQRRGDRNGSRKLTTPTMDTIYHTLRNHHNVIASQRIALEDIREKLVRAQKYDPVGALYKGPLPSPKFSSDQVEPLALQLSQTKLSTSRRQRHTPASSKKQALLRDILSRRTQTPIRSSPKVLMREEQVSSPRLSISSQESIPRVGSHPRKLDFTDNSGEDIDAVPESRFQQEIPRGRSTPVREVPQQKINLPEREPPPGQKIHSYPRQSMMQPHPQMVSAAQVQPRVPQPGLPTAATTVSRPAPSITTVIAKSSPQKEAVTTTTPSSFAHTGTGTVLWGMDSSKATPSQLAGAAALSRMASKAPGAAGEPAHPKLPPNVNIKNLDSLKSTMPPPVTFAAVASSVDTGTAQVVTQVLSEITATSGKSIPPPGTAVTDNSLRSSKSMDDPSVVSTVSEPKSASSIVSSVPAPKTSTVAEAPKSGGALHTPVASSTPVEPETTQPVKFDFTTKNNNASTSIPGGFFMSAKPVEKAGTSSEGVPKIETKGEANKPVSGQNLTLKGLLMSEPEEAEATAPASTSVTTTTQSTVGPPAGPIKFSFEKSAKPQFGGLSTGFSFGPSSTTTLTSTSSSAFSQPLFSQATSAKTEITTPTVSTPAVTKGTASGSSASGTTAESKTTGETEAAGNFVFAINKTGVNTSSVPSGGVDEAGTKPTQVEVPSSSGSGQNPPISAAVATATQSATSTSVTASSSFSFSFGGSTVKPQGGTSFSFGTPVSTTASSGVPGSASTLSKGFSFAPTAATSVTEVTNTAATSVSAVTTTPASTVGTIFSSGGTATVAASSSSTPAAPSSTPSGFSFAPSSLAGASSFGTSSSLFGGSATSKPSLFGQPTSTSGFGQTGTSTASTSSSGFSFGQPTSSSQSVFGQPTTTTQSLFGQPTTTSQSLFGQPTSSSQSVFGQPSTFGSPSTSLFGQQSGFGQTPASSAASTGLFGQATPTSDSSQSSGLFGQSASASSGGGGFGGLFGLGGKPNPEAAKINPFGVSSSSGGTGPFGTGGNSLFGSSGPKAFGSPTSSSQSTFGGGPFSSGGGGVGTGGFGGFSQQSTAPQVGFGGPPTFGGSPGGFGGKPNFGGSPGFGSGAAFSNPLGQSAFGASSPSGPVFGATSASSMDNASGGFGGFASQNTPSFGGLASSPQGSGFGSGGGGGFGSGNAFGGSGGFGGFGGTSSTNTSFGSGSFSQYRK